MNKYAFCPRCKEDVEFSTKKIKSSTEVDGTVYSYNAKQAICNTCGAVATYVPYQIANGEAFADSVRKEKGIVELGVICDLPKKYNIGKRPLSKLLGWADVTYTRFMDGAVPSKEYSDVIKRIYENPVEFQALLERNRNSITNRAYETSKRAVGRILEQEFPGFSKLQEVADYFIHKSHGDLTNSALQKLVYFSQGFSLALRKKSMFDTEPRAWAYGPVYGQLWHYVKEIDLEERGQQEYEAPFSYEEEKFLDAIYDSFGKYGGSTLSKITHIEDPWVSARERAGVSEEEKSEEKIRLDDMKSYFDYAVVRLGIEDVDDIGKYVVDALEKV